MLGPLQCGVDAFMNLGVLQLKNFGSGGEPSSWFAEEVHHCLALAHFRVLLEVGVERVRQEIAEDWARDGVIFRSGQFEGQSRRGGRCIEASR